MVKNTSGGSKQKKIARKSTVQEHASRDPTPSNEFEFIAKVDKMLGNGMCTVIDIRDKIAYLCHIRGKFRGKRKSNNFITTTCFVLVAKRDWQSQDNKECDLLSVLNDTYGQDDTSATISNDVIFTNVEEETNDDNITSNIHKKTDDSVIDFDDI